MPIELFYLSSLPYMKSSISNIYYIPLLLCLFKRVLALLLTDSQFDDFFLICCGWLLYANSNVVELLYLYIYMYVYIYTYIYIYIMTYKKLFSIHHYTALTAAQSASMIKIEKLLYISNANRADYNVSGAA
jgi:hypothetical protein